MNLDSPLVSRKWAQCLPSLTGPADVQRAWLLWGVLFVVIAVLIVRGDKRTVVNHYRAAAHAWMAGEPLYNDTGHGFLYLPSSAVLFVPFAMLPDLLGDIAWRAYTIGTYAWGVWRLCRLVRREKGIELFPLVSILCVPLAWLSARNGQATLAMTGLMMHAAADLTHQRWTRASLWLSLAFALKPLAIVMSLLVAAIHKPTRGRLALGAILALALPLICQAPSYTLGQYQDCLAMLRTAARVGEEPAWAQIFTVFAIAGVEVPARLQTVLRVLAAVGTLALVIRAQRSLSPSMRAVMLYTLATTYLMLFNPRTENNTYSCVAPAIAILSAYWGLVERRYHLAAATGLLLLPILGSYEFGKLLLPDAHGVWLAPLATALFAAVIVTLLLRNRVESGASIAPPAPADHLPASRKAA